MVGILPGLKSIHIEIKFVLTLNGYDMIGYRNVCGCHPLPVISGTKALPGIIVAFHYRSLDLRHGSSGVMNCIFAGKRGCSPVGLQSHQAMGADE
jgi:hypothetical protein